MIWTTDDGLVIELTSAIILAQVGRSLTEVATHHLLPEAGARDERGLEAVKCERLFGVADL